LVGDYKEQVQLDKIARQYGIDFQERPCPTDEDVTAVVAERTTVLLEAKLRDRDKLQAERMKRFIPLVRQWAQDEDSVSLMAMLLDDYYQQSLHAPAVPPEAEGTGGNSRQATKKQGGRRRRGRRNHSS
jgi:ATP-dependent RNA helicase DeaD